LCAARVIPVARVIAAAGVVIQAPSTAGMGLPEPARGGGDVDGDQGRSEPAGQRGSHGCVSDAVALLDSTCVRVRRGCRAVPGSKFCYRGRRCGLGVSLGESR
jgi:hypothetical protein